MVLGRVQAWLLFPERTKTILAEKPKISSSLTWQAYTYLFLQALPLKRTPLSLELIRICRQFSPLFSISG